MNKIISTILLLTLTSSLWAHCRPEVELYDIKDPVDRTQWEVSSKRYFPDVASDVKFPVVYIVPSIMGELSLERSLARRLCRRNIGAVILDIAKDAPFEEQVKNLNFQDQLMIRALASFRYIMKEINKHPNVSGKVGILGISQGAMATAFISGSEPAIDSTVIIVGAGNVKGVLTYSDQKTIEALRIARMKYYNLTTDEEYRTLLRNRAPHDPLSVAGNIKPNSTYFFVGTRDTTVPTRYQRELLAKIKGAKIFEIKGTHIGTIFKTVLLYADNILNFYSNHFNDEIVAASEAKLLDL